MVEVKKGNTAFVITRRKFVATVGAGVAVSVLGVAIGKAPGKSEVLRPPGAIDEKAFLSLCARCTRCIPVCPSSALQLQGLENGVGNLMTPKLVPSQGYCIMPINGCQNCIEACPSKVLQPLSIENLPDRDLSKVLKIGTAVLDTTICITYALKQECLACLEICPVEGAITTQGDKGRGKGGGVRKPVFNSDICVGCGACEYSCPTTPKAVTVSAEGAKRTEWSGR